MISLLVCLLTTVEIGTGKIKLLDRIVGVFGMTLSLAVIGATYYVASETMLPLYFDRLVQFELQDGFFIVFASNLVVASGCLLLIFEKGTTTKVKTDHDDNNNPQQNQSQNQNSNQLRNRNQSNTPKIQPTNKSSKRKTAQVPQKKIPIYFLLFWIPSLWFAYELYSFSDLYKPIPVNDIVVPNGFKIEVFAENVNEARSMALTER